MRRMIIKKIALGAIFTLGLVTSSMAQTFAWAKGMGSTSNDVVTDLVSDGNGNVYAVGYFYGTVDFDPGAGVTNLTSGGGRDIFMTKMDASGNLLWAVRFGAGGDDIGNGIAIDASGNVHITGGFFGTVDFDPGAGTATLGNGTGMDIFVLKLTTSGAFVWVKQFGGNNETQMGNKIAVDAAGNVYSTGQCIGVIDYDPGAGTANLGTTPSTNTNMYVSKLNSLGNYVWAKVIGNSSNAAYGMDIAVSPTQEVYTCGYFVAAVDFDPGASSTTLNSATGTAGFVHKFDASGNFAWVKPFGTETIGNETGLGIAFSNDKVYTTGYFVTTVDFDPNAANTVNLTASGGADAFIQVLGADGTFQWVKRLGGTGEDWGYGISLDATGSVYTTGFFTGTVDFDPNGGTANVTAAGNRDVYISKLDNTGNYQWGLALGGTGIDTGYGIHVNGQGAVYTGGFYQAAGDFDPTAGTATLTNAGANDLFIQKLAPQCLTPLAPANATVPATPTVCTGSSTTLNASGIGTLGWYSAATGGSYLGGGNSYVTPSITGLTSFFVQDSLCAAGPRTEIQVNVNAVVSDQAVTAAQSTICQGSATTITLADSDLGINYYLRNDANNAVIAGPVAGTGNALVFNTGNLAASTTFNVIGTSQLGSNNIGLDLDGVNDYVNISPDGRGINTTVTVSARVKANATGSSQFIVYKYNSSNGFLLFIDANGKARFDGRDGSGSYRSSGPSTTTVADGQWHDITGVVRSTGWEIYVDGVMQSSFACPPATSLYCTAAGYIGYNGTAYSNIDVDRVALWNTSLAAATILANSTACLTGSESNLTGLFNFSDGTGTIANDASPTNYDAVLTNMTAPACWIPITTDFCSPICEFEMSQLVTVTVSAPPAQPTISAGGPTTFCDGGSVTLTASAGTSYLWSNGATTASISPTTAGTYTVQVSNAAGCQSVASTGTTVTVNALPSQPTITAGGATTFCDGGSVTLTASAGTTYLWSNGATTASIAPTTSGTYTVQITNASGCQSVASAGTAVTVNTLPAQPTIAAGGPTTFCDGGSVTLTASAGNSYLWSNGATTASISPTTAGTYTVQVTNAAGCQSVASAGTTVTVNALPNAPIISPNGATTFCDGGTVNLASSAGISYLWNTGATTSSINVTSSGNYSVQITGPNGCQSPASAVTVVTVNALPSQPTITAGGPTTFCAGDDVTLTATAGNTYLWSTGETTQSIVATSANNYTVSVTNAAGCSSPSSAATMVVVNALPVISAGTLVNPTSCVLDNGSIEVLGTGTGNLSWTGAASGSLTAVSLPSTITTLGDGSYNIVFTDGNGCSSVILQADLTTPNTPPTPSITANGPLTFCEGDNVVLTATTADSYLWSNGATTQSITVTTADSYTVSVTNASGCTSLESAATIVNVDQMPVAGVSESNFVLTADQAGATYQWIDCNNGNQPIAGETGQSFTPTANGSYAVIITNGTCSVTSNCELIEGLDIKENLTLNLAVQPNPATDKVHVSATAPIEWIEIFTASGELLVGTASADFSIESFAMGMYLVHVRTTQGSGVIRLIKQ